MRALRRLVLAVLALAVVAPALAPAAAITVGTVVPTTAERVAILKAFGDPKRAWPCLIARLAVSNHNYATVRFRPTRTCGRWAFNGVNVLRRARSDRWRFVFEGSAYQCPLRRIPRQVQRDLGICDRA